MSQAPIYLLAFAVLIGVLVVVHELGHYLAARWCGVKVLRFSFGFGRVLWQRRYGRDGTEWAISAFPLGGYVKMLDEQEGEVASEDLPRAFNRQSVGKRSLIVVAGPLANFLLAIVLYWGIFMAGGNELLPIVGDPPQGSPAAAAGLRNGEQVLKVDGEAVNTWESFRWLLLQKAAKEPMVKLELAQGDGNIVERRLFLDAVAEQGWEGDALERLGLRFYRPLVPPIIGRVAEGGPAARAGVQPGDRILAIDGQPIQWWHEAVSTIRQAPGRQLSVQLMRGEMPLAVDIVSEAFSERGESFGRIGIALAESGLTQRQMTTFVQYDFVDAGLKAVRETWDKSVFSLVMLGKMLVGEVSWKNLSGPVTIADYAGQSARLGLDYYIKFMALVSISLGVLNLLPIPVLDGGHLMYHMIEVVRRKPLSERSLAIGQQVGLSILFVLMAFAFFNDLIRLFGG